MLFFKIVEKRGKTDEGLIGKFTGGTFGFCALNT